MLAQGGFLFEPPGIELAPRPPRAMSRHESRPIPWTPPSSPQLVDAAWSPSIEPARAELRRPLPDSGLGAPEPLGELGQTPSAMLVVERIGKAHGRVFGLCPASHHRLRAPGPAAARAMRSSTASVRRQAIRRRRSAFSTSSSMVGK